MIFTFTDSRNFSYEFIIDEDDLTCVSVMSIDNRDIRINCGCIPY